MATRVAIASRVRKIVVEQLGVNVAELRDDAVMTDDLGADSLEISHLAMVIEDEFGIYLTEKSLEKLVTVGDVIDFITFFNKEVALTCTAFPSEAYDG